MIRLGVLLAAMLAASPAGAHGTLPGGGGFYAGLAHPFLAIDHLLVLIATGLAVAQGGQRHALAVLTLGLLAGLVLARLGLGVASLQPIILILALVIATALAVARPLPRAVLPVLASAAGLGIGMDTDVPFVTIPQGLIACGGVVIGVLVIVLNAMVLGSTGQRLFDGLPLRIAGSWIMAASIMVLAFMLRGVMGGAA
jgi:urease accessory protein